MVYSGVALGIRDLGALRLWDSAPSVSDSPGQENCTHLIVSVLRPLWSNVGALIIRIGFGGRFYCNYAI